MERTLSEWAFPLNRKCERCVRGALRTRRHMRVSQERRELNGLAIDTTGPFIPGWELIGPGKPLRMNYVLVGAFK